MGCFPVKLVNRHARVGRDLLHIMPGRLETPPEQVPAPFGPHEQEPAAGRQASKGFDKSLRAIVIRHKIAAVAGLLEAPLCGRSDRCQPRRSKAAAVEAGRPETLKHAANPIGTGEHNPVVGAKPARDGSEWARIGGRRDPDHRHVEHGSSSCPHEGGGLGLLTEGSRHDHQAARERTDACQGRGAPDKHDRGRPPALPARLNSAGVERARGDLLVRPRAAAHERHRSVRRPPRCHQLP